MFLRLLGKHELGNFSVRGRHSTLHMVDLPGSLPDALLQEMITMHRHYLGELFKKIIFSPMACEIRPRTPLIENDPALRTACTVEDEFIPLPPLTSLAISLAAGLSTVCSFLIPMITVLTHGSSVGPVAVLAHIPFLEYSIQTYSSRHINRSFRFVYRYFVLILFSCTVYPPLMAAIHLGALLAQFPHASLLSFSARRCELGYFIFFS